MRILMFTLLLISLELPAQTFPPKPFPASMPGFNGNWMVEPESSRSDVYLTADKKDLVLYNGHVRRSFRVAKGVGCYDYTNLANGRQHIRAIRPEAVLDIDGREYMVGGLYGQTEKAYLKREWLDSLDGSAADFQPENYEITQLSYHLNFRAPRGVKDSSGPLPKGLVLNFYYSCPELPGLRAGVHYEIWDGMPLIVKYVTLRNTGQRSYTINRVKNEVLDMVEEESAVVGSPTQMKLPQGIYFETNYAFNNAMRYQISDQTTHWKTDSSYTSQVNYNYQTPCVLEIYPDHAPGIRLKPEERFHSVRTYELMMPGDDREARGMAIRKMYRRIAPWTSYNPIFMHLVSRNDAEVIRAIDQCDSTGYEAVILSFGSHLNMEDTGSSNLERWKKLADYAHNKNIMLGGYSLFSSRKISEADDVINPATGKTGGAFFGNAPCFGSKWGLAYKDKILKFFRHTGFDIWENDGPYPGDRCASTTHPGHEGLEDSQWRQMELQKGLYHALTASGVYINAPDWYFLDGTHKTAIGYREVNFSLPRENQKILNRQNIYDGTWEKTPSMGWGFVPLVRYQGGGPEAVLEPLREHLDDYEQLMMQYYGAGVQACYRGPRLYDAEVTRQLVVKVIKWYKKHREILNADIIHLRRADGRDWDGWIHADPRLREKGLMMLFNPTASMMKREISIPVRWMGSNTSFRVTDMNGTTRTYNVDSRQELRMEVDIRPNSYGWWIFE